MYVQAGKYVWRTYKEVYDLVIKVGNAIRSCGLEEVRLYLIGKFACIHFSKFFFFNLLVLMYFLLVYREENVVFMVQIAQSGLLAWRYYFLVIYLFFCGSPFLFILVIYSETKLKVKKCQNYKIWGRFFQILFCFLKFRLTY